MNEPLTLGAKPSRTGDQPRPAAGTSATRILEGDCWAFFAFDIGMGIDLDAAQAMFAGGAAGTELAHRTEISHQRRAEKYLQFRTAPLQVDQTGLPPLTLELGGFKAEPRVECTLYDFGVASVAFRISLSRATHGIAFDELIPLAVALGDNKTLWREARNRVEDLSHRLGRVIDRPCIIDIVEDYIVYHIQKWTPESDAREVVNSHRPQIARILLAEPSILSQQAVDMALESQLTYSPDDVAVIDWNAAVLIDAQAADAIAVLEFANVELLEMRFIDDRLDSILDRSYSSLLRQKRRFRPGGSPLGFLLDPHRAERQRLAALQMENAILFEGINNTLKLVGDQHLARLYALAARRLHLSDWDQSILRKLHTADALYQKLADEQAARRMEILEWIIILLITISIVLPFLLKSGH